VMLMLLLLPGWIRVLVGLWPVAAIAMWATVAPCGLATWAHMPGRGDGGGGGGGGPLPLLLHATGHWGPGGVASMQVVAKAMAGQVA